MRRRIAVVVIVLAAGLTPVAHAQQATAKTSACVVCHTEIESPDLSDWSRDVHAEVGLGCVGCHGGDPSPALAEDDAASMSPAKGFRNAPGRLQVARFCGDCHADAEFMKRYDPQARVDQLAEYRTSVHGQRNAAGDPTPATCTDCHGVHGIRRVDASDSPVYAPNVPAMCARCHTDAAMMQPYGIPIDQHAKYLRSVHAAALLERQDTAAPACNDCHGNHGATPPGVQSVANVCGQCHGREAQLFRDSFKKELFDGLDVAECSVCHGNHRVTHPTPELFRSGSEPRVSQGRVGDVEPFRAELGELEAGVTAEAVWIGVLSPHLEHADTRLAHRVAITGEGLEPLEIDATVRPDGSIDPPQARKVAGGGLTATLSIRPLSGVPVKAGDALEYRLELTADAAVGDLRVASEVGTGIDVVHGSVCLTCHSPGDACDVATEKMYAGLATADAELREAERILRRAELAGMDVGETQFELNSSGVTAALDSRALIHTFEPERLIARTEETREIAGEAREAGEAAWAELQFRRKGLAVSLVLIALVLVGLLLKIRDVDRRRRTERQRA